MDQLKNHKFRKMDKGNSWLIFDLNQKIFTWCNGVIPRFEFVYDYPSNIWSHSEI